MLKLSYEEIIEKILAGCDLPKEEIEHRIDTKWEGFNGLLSKEGAAHMIANEVGVKLFDAVPKKNLKVNDLREGMKYVELLLKIINISEVREFEKDDRKGKVLNIFAGDETGRMRVVFWDNSQIDKVSSLKEGDIIIVKGANVRLNNGFTEAHATSNAEIEVNPEGVSIVIGEGGSEVERKKIKDLNDGDFAEVSGIIVSAFEPRFYDSCPECPKKAVINDEGKYVCATHGEVVAKPSPIFNIVIDDGSENIRVTLFRENVGLLMKKNDSEVIAMREDPSLFPSVREKLIGSEILVKGRVRMNDFSGNLEMNANSVSEVDFKKESEKLIDSVKDSSEEVKSEEPKVESVSEEKTEEVKEEPQVEIIPEEKSVNGQVFDEERIE